MFAIKKSRDPESKHPGTLVICLDREHSREQQWTGDKSLSHPSYNFELRRLFVLVVDNLVRVGVRPSNLTDCFLVEKFEVPNKWSDLSIVDTFE